MKEGKPLFSSKRGASPEEIRQTHVQRGKNVDLTKSFNPEIEGELKQEYMRVREIILEQDRLTAILRDKFQFLQSPEAFDAYCERSGIGESKKIFVLFFQRC